MDNSLKYNNFYPKQILNFAGDTQILNVKFGKHHEAYLDKKGWVHVCKKYATPSVKLNDNDTKWEFDHVLEVKGKKFVDLCFTKLWLFCLTENGDVYMFVMKESIPESANNALYESEIKIQCDFDPFPWPVEELR